MRFEFHLSDFFARVFPENSANDIIADSELHHIERGVLTIKGKSFTVLESSGIRSVSGFQTEIV